MAASDPFYQDIKLEVDTILAEFGTSFTVRGEGVYDEDTLTTSDGATRTVTGVISTQQDVNAIAPVLYPIGENSAAWQNRKTLILRADANPTPSEEVQVDGEWYSLGKVVALKPADVVVVYFLDLLR